MKEMGCKVDFQNDRLSISSASIEDAPLEFSPSGHPVITVTAFDEGQAYVPADFKDPPANAYYIGDGAEEVEDDDMRHEPLLKKLAHGTRKKLASAMASLAETFKTDAVTEKRTKA